MSQRQPRQRELPFAVLETVEDDRSVVFFAKLTSKRVFPENDPKIAPAAERALWQATDLVTCYEPKSKDKAAFYYPATIYSLCATEADAKAIRESRNDYLDQQSFARKQNLNGSDDEVDDPKSGDESGEESDLGSGKESGKESDQGSGQGSGQNAGDESGEELSEKYGAESDEDFVDDSNKRTEPKLPVTRQRTLSLNDDGAPRDVAGTSATKNVGGKTSAKIGGGKNVASKSGKKKNELYRARPATLTASPERRKSVVPKIVKRPAAQSTPKEKENEKKMKKKMNDKERFDSFMNRRGTNETAANSNGNDGTSERVVTVPLEKWKNLEAKVNESNEIVQKIHKLLTGRGETDSSRINSTYKSVKVIKKTIGEDNNITRRHVNSALKDQESVAKEPKLFSDNKARWMGSDFSPKINDFYWKYGHNSSFPKLLALQMWGNRKLAFWILQEETSRVGRKLHLKAMDSSGVKLFIEAANRWFVHHFEKAYQLENPDADVSMGDDKEHFESVMEVATAAELLKQLSRINQMGTDYYKTHTRTSNAWYYELLESGKKPHDNYDETWEWCPWEHLMTLKTAENITLGEESEIVVDAVAKSKQIFDDKFWPACGNDVKLQNEFIRKWLQDIDSKIKPR